MIFLKDPDATLDYLINFGQWLPDGDSVTDKTVTADAGLTVDSSTIVAGTAKDGTTVQSGAVQVWVSGGTLGAEYDVTCHITTDGGRINDETFTVRIVAT